MAFKIATDSEGFTPSEKLCKRLAAGLRIRGFSVKSGYMKRWSPDMVKLVAEHGKETVGKVIDYLHSEGQTNQYCPQVQSATALCNKFHKLMYLSGANLISQKVHPRARTICESSPLRWPFPDDYELEWLSMAMEGIDENMQLLDSRQQMLMGSSWVVAKQWRDIKNERAWRFDVFGFHQLMFVKDNDFAYNQILRNHTNEDKNRFRSR